MRTSLARRPFPLNHPAWPPNVKSRDFSKSRHEPLKPTNDWGCPTFGSGRGEIAMTFPPSKDGWKRVSINKIDPYHWHLYGQRIRTRQSSRSCGSERAVRRETNRPVDRSGGNRGQQLRLQEPFELGI